MLAKNCPRLWLYKPVVAPGSSAKVSFYFYLSFLALNNFRLVGYQLFFYHNKPEVRKCWCSARISFCERTLLHGSSTFVNRYKVCAQLVDVAWPIFLKQLTCSANRWGHWHLIDGSKANLSSSILITFFSSLVFHLSSFCHVAPAATMSRDRVPMESSEGFAGKIRSKKDKKASFPSAMKPRSRFCSNWHSLAERTSHP